MNAPEETASVVLTRQEMDGLRCIVRHDHEACSRWGYLQLESRVALLAKLEAALATLPELEVPF